MSTASLALSDTRHRREVGDVYQTFSRVMIYLLVILAVSVIGFPIFWMVICSFKPATELYASPPTFLPHRWVLDNYIQLFAQTSFGTYLINSLVVAFGTTFLSLAIGGFGAYSLSRFNFFGMRAFANLTLVVYMLPEVLIVLPLYIYVIKFGLADTLVSLIVANTTFTLPLTLWFLRSYFNAVPASLEESAMIDGCTRLGAMRRVTLPLVLPGIVSVGVFSFNHAWNEFLFALVFISSEKNKTLPLGLATWIGQDNLYSWGMLLASAVLITIPVVVFYMLVQNSLVSGLAEGATKGE